MVFVPSLNSGPAGVVSVNCSAIILKRIVSPEIQKLLVMTSKTKTNPIQLVA